MTRRTMKPVTRAEAKRILAAPVRDVEHARLAASYLDLMDAVRSRIVTAGVRYPEENDLLDVMTAAAEDDPE